MDDRDLGGIVSMVLSVHLKKKTCVVLLSTISTFFSNNTLYYLLFLLLLLQKKIKIRAKKYDNEIKNYLLPFE
jgi:hypothetical protein